MRAEGKPVAMAVRSPVTRGMRHKRVLVRFIPGITNTCFTQGTEITDVTWEREMK